MSQDYLRHIGDRQNIVPVLRYEQAPLLSALVGRGAASIMVPDALETHHVTSSPLYFGATTPKNTKEVPHWHTDQVEAYVVVDGECELVGKYRWQDNGWVHTVGRKGDVLVAMPQSCHWLVWRSENGLAYVFKAPQRAGVGPYPAGKTTCLKGCPFYNKGCCMPVSSNGYRFTPEVPAKV